ncbi:Energy-coupling factor transporter transmembrane protein EcfT [Microbacterium sp. MM2322]
MLSLYRPGTGRLHRMPAGPKVVVLVAIASAVSFLPSTWWAAMVAVGVALTCYLFADLGDGALGMRDLGRQLRAVRWILALTAASQLLFSGPEAALSNTARVSVMLVVSGLLALTTRATELLGALERGLRPLRALGLDTEQLALMLSVTVAAIPVLARHTRELRDAQHARGSRGSVRAFIVPFLVIASKHAFDVGDALSARGVR